jgi:hypothetical protein
VRRRGVHRKRNFEDVDRARTNEYDLYGIDQFEITVNANAKGIRRKRMFMMRVIVKITRTSRRRRVRRRGVHGRRNFKDVDRARREIRGEKYSLFITL